MEIQERNCTGSSEVVAVGAPFPEMRRALLYCKGFATFSAFIAVAPVALTAKLEM